MIKVTYLEKNNDVLEFSSIGHANSSKGDELDLICGSVSCVIIGGLNALENESCYDIDVKEGSVILKANSKPSNHDNIVLQTIITQLKTIENKYSKYISIRKL
ncbi:MAG: ribosomal-processing cysteine protease Prp [Bacilli bacterium]